jgi:hypothetical protein
MLCILLNEVKFVDPSPWDKVFSIVTLKITKEYTYNLSLAGPYPQGEMSGILF